MRLCGWSALGARLALIGNEAYANEIGRLSC
jgi:hypothetical protein